eukprot:3996746-Prymnesium_polylepis.1
MANGALAAMRDPRRAISSLLTSQEGEFAAGKDPSVHKATVGAHVTTDRVESNFGCIDILMRMFRCAAPPRSPLPTLPPLPPLPAPPCRIFSQRLRSPPWRALSPVLTAPSQRLPPSSQ